MTIQIIGGGAVGLLLASFFEQSFGQVVLVARRNQQREGIHNKGIVKYNLQNEGQSFAVESAEQLCEHSRLVVVATKYEGLSAIYPLLARLPADVPLLFVQNGLAHFEEALRLPQRTIIFGSAQFGAERKSDTEVIHRGLGVLKLAVAKGNVKDVEWLEQLANVELPLEWVEDAQYMLFEKALLNCFINPITAILQVKNGALVTNPEAYCLLRALYAELMEAFPTMKQRFPFESVEALCQRTAANTSSMLGDRLAGRRSEVDTIVGAVLRKGQAAGFDLPVLQTLYSLLKALEWQGSGRES